MSTRQVSTPCSKCGSMYRNGELCNICKSIELVKESETMMFSLEGKPPIGRVWDKKLHRYIK